VARVLLIDEIESTREGITLILRRLGHHVEAKVSPDAASEWLRTHVPDVIFLAGRALAWSPVRALEQVRSIQRPPPVVWLDSSPPEFAGKPPEAFLARSPEQPDIQKTLANLFGEGRTGEWTDMTFLRSVSGPLEQYPPIRVLALAHRVKATGRINIVTDEGRKTIDVDAGRVVQASGFHDLLEFLGLNNGPDDDLAQVLGRGVKAGMAADAALNIAAQTLGARLADLLGQDGHVEFDANAKPHGQSVVLPVTVPRMLTEGLKVSRSIDRIRPLYLGTRGGRVEVKVPHGVGLEQLGLDPVAYRLLRKAQKIPQIDLLLKSEEGDADARILALDLLAALGYIRIKAGTPVERVPQEAEEEPRPKPEAARENLMTEEMALTTKVKTRALKKAEDPKLVELKLLRDRFRAATAVEVLGVEQLDDLTPETLDRKFREVSQLYHPDRYSNDGKGFRLVADDIFSLVNQAYEALKDPTILEEARERIRAKHTGAVFVSRREKNLAKISFAKGEIHFRARRWGEAYDDLSEAVKLDSMTWRYKALQLQAGFWAEKLTAREASEGIDEIVKDLALKADAAENPNEQDQHRNAIADLLFQLGEIWIRAGDEARAYKLFERAKTVNPKHAAALRRLWLKQVREEGRTSKPASLVEPTRASRSAPSAAKKDEPSGALSGIMGIFGKKK
jgi:tetratricopeptide (TPR) repeat protein/CheY-like chemotaxis protein